jgi:CIC family chloride channel protein
MERSKIIHYHIYKLVLISLLVGILGSIMAFFLKYLTEYFQERIFKVASENNSLLFILLPTIGITSIYFLRKYLFQKRRNKGITEIYKTLDQRKDHLQFFKIPSHFLNGFLTVIFGGSTGIEVSTVVASATVGNMAYEREFSAKMYKRELICAGVTAGVAVLFTSPVVGWLFAMEVIARKTRKTLVISCTVSALAAWAFIYFFDNQPLFHFRIETWNWYALPFFLILSCLGGLLAVYFTLLVTRMKALFSKISNNFLQVNTGAVTVGLLILAFPILYGDSYHGLKELFEKVLSAQNISIVLLIFLILLKPLVASLTLGAGGDGGVFAPSIVAGAFMGLLVAQVGNTYFDLGLIPVNFALVGIAATLSAAIYAPFTALVLVCSLTPNGYVLFFPILIGSFTAQYISKKILPYNVYTYDFYMASKNQG